jgi:peptidoglycan/xylan/chitin deacetylase (PgdA/CDA1 family)
MTILCYHSIHPDWNSPLSVDPVTFAAHCRWLRTHRRLITLEEAIQEMIHHRPRRSRGVAVTFDDALADFHDYAFPILERYSVPASVFVVTKTLEDPAAEADWIDPPSKSPIETLTSSQITELRDQGISFYSHTHTHRDLTKLDDRTCEEDLRRSRDVLGALLAAPVNILAYPRGDYDARVARLAARAGFEYAVGTSKGTEPIGPLSIPRAGLYRGEGRVAVSIKTSSLYMPMRRSNVLARSRHEIAEVVRWLSSRGRSKS